MPSNFGLSLKLTVEEIDDPEVKKFLQALLGWMVERWSLGAEEADRIAFQKDRMSRCRPPMARVPRLAAASAPA